MKRLIYQVATGPRSKLYEHCIKSVETYCNENDIDHKVQRTPILRIKPDVFSTNRSKSRMKSTAGFFLSTRKKTRLHTLTSMIKSLSSMQIFGSDLVLQMFSKLWIQKLISVV